MKATPAAISRPRTAARSVFSSGLGETGWAGATAGSMTVSRLDAWLAENERRVA